MLDIILTWLIHGIWGLSFLQLAVITLVLTHLTIVSVTLYLHRYQAHRTLEMKSGLAHFFRFWLWLTTGMGTKAWVAVHRKHHAKCETQDDPHSPKIKGIKTLMLRGAELYREAAQIQDTLTRYGKGTPEDWIEKNVYSRHHQLGINLMLILDLLFFGVIGLTVWAVQMIWIPLFAAGMVNGIGHYWGYRNFDIPDQSTNFLPIGIIIGGEELHNNHHTYPTSAKFSIKRYELDIGWVYIKLLSWLGWVEVKRVPPQIQYSSHLKLSPEEENLHFFATLRTNLIKHRHEFMKLYAQEIKKICNRELAKIQGTLPKQVVKVSRRWMHKIENIPESESKLLEIARKSLPECDFMVTMRDDLKKTWLDTKSNSDQLVEHIKTWCHAAEKSGIESLVRMAQKLKAVSS
ncbi:MAG: fatty acid desaturase [Gammaproteobacteria bacterium]|nr:fatty acid desaturase [Gammaproteobacteria bacterium]